MAKDKTIQRVIMCLYLCNDMRANTAIDSLLD